MLREMCKAKIHRATVTDANLHYEGSITIDEELLVAADILPYEKYKLSTLITVPALKPMSLRKEAAAPFASRCRCPSCPAR